MAPRRVVAATRALARRANPARHALPADHSWRLVAIFPACLVAIALPIGALAYMVGSKEDSTASQASSEAITPSAVENVESMSTPSAVENVESMSSGAISPVETVKRMSPSSGV
jgi:hypothetical protein